MCATAGFLAKEGLPKALFSISKDSSRLETDYAGHTIFYNGSKLKRIFEKLDEENVHYQFPNNVKTFTHPIVIGCNATKRTGHDSFLPIIIYHANANHGNASNTSTFKITYGNQSLKGS
ncbi:AKR_collapsed_G0047280.mRNA.1.CDS.1 [Saccharomyces cerevisiae]|nr:AKR_collapsed_G0047280.mRNA.1.CDS.1 [Saccharomyces cerevisiae]